MLVLFIAEINFTLSPSLFIHVCSHSSIEKLTKHWKNTTSMEPENCPCFPCHKMHFGFSTCNRDKETGGALCAANIHHERVVQDILGNLK